MIYGLMSFYRSALASASFDNRFLSGAVRLYRNTLTGDLRLVTVSTDGVSKNTDTHRSKLDSITHINV